MATKDIYKESDKLDISVSNSKDDIDRLLGIANKYGWECLALMVNNVAGNNKIFQWVEQIYISGMYNELHGYFVLIGIENVVNIALTNPHVVSDIQTLAGYS